MSPDLYSKINRGWPATIPPITRIEAQRAVRKLVTHFEGPAWIARRPVRRCWISLDPAHSSGLDRGWRRLVHDLSHYLYRAKAPRTTRGRTQHSGIHAHWENELREYVLAHGWLEGTLKPAVKPKVKPTLSDRIADKLKLTEARLARWQRREKLATTKVKQYDALRRSLTRRLARALEDEAGVAAFRTSAEAWQHAEALNKKES